MTRLTISITGVLLSVFGLLWAFFMSDSSSSAEQGNAVPKHLQGIDSDNVDWKGKGLDFWRDVLSPEAFAVCRLAGTERPFSGKYCATKAHGSYYCSCCGQKLFSSGDKFDSGTGWPSFSEAAIPGALEEIEDRSHGMIRTEVRCNRCKAHLGHVFDDSPPPTGKRYCINSVCLFQRADP